MTQDVTVHDSGSGHSVLVIKYLIRDEHHFIRNLPIQDAIQDQD